MVVRVVLVLVTLVVALLPSVGCRRDVTRHGPPSRFAGPFWGEPGRGAAPTRQQRRLGEAVGSFGLRLAREVALETPGNVCVSPYSVSVALAMLLEGARGETREEIARTLGVSGRGDKPLSLFGSVDASLRAYEPTLTVRGASGVWLAQDLVPAPNYLDAVSKGLGSEVRRTTFPEPGRTEANGWVSQKTAGQIGSVLPAGSLTPDTRLVLVSALYFLAGWQHEFSPEKTADGTFHTPAGDVTVRMMHDSSKRRYAAATVAGCPCQVVELPYATPSVAMVLIVPEKGVEPLASPEWERDVLACLETNGMEAEVELTLPRWDLASSAKLSGALGRMGMPTAFGAGADLSGLVPAEPTLVDEVYHATRVTVDESGTRAAAATAVPVVKAAAPRVVVAADHPFLYLIRDAGTHQVLFVGRVTNPKL